MTLAGLSIRRPVATTMAMLSIIFIGIIAMFSMKSEMLPNMAIPVVTISTSWNGAVAEDVENQITNKIEEILPKVEGIDKIESTSSYERSQVIVKFKFGVDANEKTTEIQRELSKITNRLPQDATTPIARKVNAGAGDMTLIAMFSSPNTNELSTFIKEYLKPKLESLNGIGQVSIYGNPTKQIQIQFDSDKLAAFDLTPVELYNILASSTKNIPLGTIKTGNKDIIARFMGELNTIDDLKNVIIQSNGNTLRLGDVADVILTTEDSSDLGYLSGKKAMTVVIEKSADGSTIELNQAALKAIDGLKGAMPPDTNFKVLMDTSNDIKSSISGVSGNAIQGLILATIVLFLFLKNMRATFLISAALPVAIIFTFAFLALNGTTINLISLMGLSIGVGMLTDNSVVVVDNIYRHMTELHEPTMEAAENGATEVSFSVIASGLTTMVVFIPVLFIPGIAREIFRDLSFSIIFSNIAALLVSLTFIPMLASRFLSNKIKISSDGKIFAYVKEKYLKIINWVLKNRWKTLGLAALLFVLTIGIGKNFLQIQFFPRKDSGRYSISAELGKGLDIEKSERIAREIENIVKDNKYTKFYFTMVNPSSVSINVNIGKKDTRKISVFKLMDEIRPLVAEIPDARISVTEKFSMGSAPRAAQIDIMGPNLDEIKKIGKSMLDDLKKYKGAVDVKSTLDPGNTEARIVLKREKIKSFGLNPITVGQTLSYSLLGGNRGNTVSIKTGVEEIDVLVRLPKDKRQDINDIRNINIRVGKNKFVKASDLADIYYAEGSTAIDKTDRIYSVTIGANDGGVGLRNIQQEMIRAFEATNPPKSVTYKWGGDTENMKNAMGQLGMALGISIFLIYALLASQFENFLLPFIIIGSIPLSIIGIVFGLIITNQPIDIMVMIGLILLAGVVVNNAIVLIDFILLMLKRGFKRNQAVVESCRTRLRPILMTTMTTVLGMLPLSLGIGEGSEIYRGMAITVMFGLIFATLLTLIVIPILFTLVDDLIKKTRRMFKKIIIKIYRKKRKNRG